MCAHECVLFLRSSGESEKGTRARELLKSESAKSETVQSLLSGIFFFSLSRSQ